MSNRPDVMAASNIFSQVPEEMFDPKQHVKTLKKVIMYLQDTEKANLIYRTLNMEQAKLIVFADGSHATNLDGTSELGYMVFLADKINWNFLQYKSYKSRRVVRSPLATEMHALSDVADACVLIQHDVQIVTGRRFAIILLRD